MSNQMPNQVTESQIEINIGRMQVQTMKYVQQLTDELRILQAEKEKLQKRVEELEKKSETK